MVFIVFHSSNLLDTGRKLNVHKTRSEDALGVFWTSYVRSIYELCPGDSVKTSRTFNLCTFVLRTLSSGKVLINYRLTTLQTVRQVLSVYSPTLVIMGSFPLLFLLIKFLVVHFIAAWHIRIVFFLLCESCFSSIYAHPHASHDYSIIFIAHSGKVMSLLNKRGGRKLFKIF